MTNRRKFTSEFKKKVVLEALKERETLSELAQKYDLHPQQITLWKAHFLAHAEEIFVNSSHKRNCWAGKKGLKIFSKERSKNSLPLNGKVTILSPVQSCQYESLNAGAKIHH